MAQRKLSYRNILLWGSNNNLGATVQGDAIIDEDQQILAWIKRFSPNVVSAKLTEHFATNFMDDVLANESFKACKTNTSQTIVLVGKAGVGKTTTVQGITKDLREAKGDSKVAVASVYYDWSVSEDSQPSKVMMLLLGQFVNEIPRSVKKVRNLYSKNKESCPSAEEIAGVLIAILKDARPACVFVDGLDECRTKERLVQILQLLSRIQEDTRIGVFLTDRMSENALWEVPFKKPHLIQLDKSNDQDISSYIDNRLSNTVVGILLRKNPELLEDTKQVITDASDGIFLFVRVNVEYIMSKEAKTESSLRADLDVITQITSDAESRQEYEQHVNQFAFLRYLKRFMPENDHTHDAELAKHVFRFVRDAARPFKVAELQRAVAWNGRKKASGGPDRDWQDIRRVCFGLIETDDSGDVQFYHQTLRLTFELPEVRAKLPNSNAELGMICVQYLSQTAFSSGACVSQTDRETLLDENPFLRYAATHWHQHFKHCEASATSEDPDAFGARNRALFENFCADALHFLRLDPNVELSAQMAKHNDALLTAWSAALQVSARAGPTMFHELPIIQMASGLFDKLRGDIEGSEDLDPFVACGTTGLHLASRHGLLRLVRSLLSGHKAFDCTDRQSRTPLHIAAGSNHVPIVEALLQRGAHPDSRDKFGFSPLMSAAQHGARDVVKLLVNATTSIDINAQTNSRCTIYKRSALHIAASKGHTEVAKILLAHPRVNVNLRDSHGEAPVHLATKMGELAMMKILVSSGKNSALEARVECHSEHEAVDSNCFCGCNALHLASMEDQRWDILEYLLRHGPHLYSALDRAGRTPMHHAAGNGALKNVVSLLEYDSEQVNVVDEMGWPPVAHAIRSRDTKMFKVLWKCWTGGAYFKNKKGTTLLDYASSCGSDSLVDFLRSQSPPPSRRPTFNSAKVPNAVGARKEGASDPSLQSDSEESSASWQTARTKRSSKHSSLGSPRVSPEKRSTAPDPLSATGSSKRLTRGPLVKPPGKK